MSQVQRSAMTRALWVALWCLWLALCAQQIADLARFNAPWPMWTLRVLPLVLFMPGVARDNLRAVVWLCFVTLFYFVSAVELIFARPEDSLAVMGLVAVVGLFIAAAMYIRVRGPELRRVTGDSASHSQPEETDSQEK